MEVRFSLGVYALLALVVVGVIACIWAIGRGNTTTAEGILLSVVLTILSAIVSWTASYYYSSYSSGKNLKVFARKAAEKVTNLSNELDRLSMFLQGELEADEYETPTQTVLARDLRIEGAIHIINTLKSVNDGSLSDWQGVIGDEISAQRERQQEREEELSELLERFESLYAAAPLAPAVDQGEGAVALRAEVQAIRADLRTLASQVSGLPVRRIKSMPPMERIDTSCPNCVAPIHYQQRAKKDGYKSVLCRECGAKLLSRFVNGQIVVQTRSPVEESIACASCAEPTLVYLDPMPGSAIQVQCASCGTALRVFRTPGGIGVRVVEAASAAVRAMDEEVLKSVEQAMPPQPWPKGATKRVAAELGLSTQMARGAVNELVRRGVFKPQIDGQLYVKEEPPE